MSAAPIRRRGGRRAWGDVGILGVAATIVAIALTVVLARPDRFDGRDIVFAVAAVLAGGLVAGERDGLSVSGAFIVYVLAGALLGPRSAIAAAVLAELAASARLRTRPRAMLLCNLPATALPAIASALVVSAVAGTGGHRHAVFFVAVGAGALLAMALSFALFATLRRLALPELTQFGLGDFVRDLPNIVLNLLVVVAGAALAATLGVPGLAFALSSVLTFSYMARLIDRARLEGERHLALSWGVLGGLIRSLDVRDSRAARHAAAVAAFSRDIARAVGMPDAEVELAHMAGLLHDIGHFALSDRVAERGRALTDEDWAAIHRHPELGADLLRDLGIYGPVAEIVLAHHERIDGRGYPRGLVGPDIPEIAKIVAVAEVYDTLTAGDTYRTRMGSFEALVELRRVAGTQLEARYVEMLGALLSGEGMAYRHADAANFDAELDVRRRVSAGSPRP